MLIDVDKAMVQKRVLENKIKIAVNEFQMLTGLAVCNITISRIREVNTGRNPEARYVIVSVEIPESYWQNWDGGTTSYS